MSLKGASTNPLDDKNRVSLSTKYRKQLEDLKLVLVKAKTKGLKHLMLFTEAGYQDYIDAYFKKNGEFDWSDDDDVQLMFQMQEASEDVSIDASYRIRITDDLKKYAGFDKEIHFTGMRDCVFLTTPEVAEQLRGGKFE